MGCFTLQSALELQCALQQSLSMSLGTARTDEEAENIPSTSPCHLGNQTLTHQTGPQSCLQNTVSLGFTVGSSKQGSPASQIMQKEASISNTSLHDVAVPLRSGDWAEYCMSSQQASNEPMNLRNRKPCPSKRLPEHTDKLTKLCFLSPTVIWTLQRSVIWLFYDSMLPLGCVKDYSGARLLGDTTLLLSKQQRRNRSLVKHLQT